MKTIAEGRRPVFSRAVSSFSKVRGAVDAVVQPVGAPQQMGVADMDEDVLWPWKFGPAPGHAAHASRSGARRA